MNTKSKASQDQSSVTQQDEAILNATGLGSRIINVSNAAGDVDLKYTSQGIDTSQFVATIDALSGGAQQVIDSQSESQNKMSTALSEITSVVTGARSELGLMFSQYMKPIAIIAGLIAGIWAWKKLA